MTKESGPSGRFETVSRRTLLKATAGVGLAALLPTACGNSDNDILEGALTDLVTSNDLAAVPTTAPLTMPLATPAELGTEAGQLSASDAAETPAVETPTTPEPSAELSAAPAPETPTTETPTTPEPIAEPTAEPTVEPTMVPATSTVAGSLITNFTYTQGAGGKNENPYVAVWIENTSGDLVQTIALFYDRNHRKGADWLDHLLQWWDADQARIRAGGTNTITTISSATRAPGEYAVHWDGTAGGTAAPAGNYVFCIESSREEGLYSLITQPLTLNAQGMFHQLSDNGELSNASVQTSA